MQNRRMLARPYRFACSRRESVTQASISTSGSFIGATSVAASLWGMVTPETLFSYHHGLGRVRIYPVFNSVKLVSNGPAWRGLPAVALGPGLRRCLQGPRP